MLWYEIKRSVGVHSGAQSVVTAAIAGTIASPTIESIKPNALPGRVEGRLDSLTDPRLLLYTLLKSAAFMDPW